MNSNKGWMPRMMFMIGLVFVLGLSGCATNETNSEPVNMAPEAVAPIHPAPSAQAVMAPEQAPAMGKSGMGAGNMTSSGQGCADCKGCCKKTCSPAEMKQGKCAKAGQCNHKSGQCKKCCKHPGKSCKKSCKSKPKCNKAQHNKPGKKCDMPTTPAGVNDPRPAPESEHRH
ncbi:MAG: hypothetical protein HQL98_03180 [Magnetococcales bacterium]|nr:hypothetical protein [Magnetococcales bacterium]